MLIASILLTNISVSKSVEATFQNFAAGLILAAVASELFPLMLTENVSPFDTWVGVSVGFVVGLVTLNGLESFIEYMIDHSNVGMNKLESHLQTSESPKEITGIDTIENGMKNVISYSSLGSPGKSEMNSTKSTSKTMNQIVNKFQAKISNKSDESPSYINQNRIELVTTQEIEEFTGTL